MTQKISREVTQKVTQKLKRQAQCSCGSVRIVATGEPDAVVACHCLECQRRTGSVFGVGAYFSPDKIKITGQTQPFSRPTESGEIFTSNFCPKCGTSVFWKIEQETERVGVAVGAFGDPSFPHPDRSVWEQSKHPWVCTDVAQEHFSKGRVPQSIQVRSTRLPELEFWFDFASTYSYLTCMRIEKLCTEKQIRLRWRPFLLGPIFKDQGWNNSPFNIYPAEGNYMWKEMERHSRAYGLHSYRKPSQFPRVSLLGARIALVAQDEKWVGEFVRAVYRANFEKDQDISNKDVLSGILDNLGIDSTPWFAQAEEEKAKLNLRDQTERARSLGIFGAPSFTIGQELFWGDDRLEEALHFGSGGICGPMSHT